VKNLLQVLVIIGLVLVLSGSNPAIAKTAEPSSLHDVTVSVVEMNGYVSVLVTGGHASVTFVGPRVYVFQGTGSFAFEPGHYTWNAQSYIGDVLLEPFAGEIDVVKNVVEKAQAVVNLTLNNGQVQADPRLIVKCSNVGLQGGLASVYQYSTGAKLVLSGGGLGYDVVMSDENLVVLLPNGSYSAHWEALPGYYIDRMSFTIAIAPCS